MVDMPIFVTAGRTPRTSARSPRWAVTIAIAAAMVGGRVALGTARGQESHQGRDPGVPQGRDPGAITTVADQIYSDAQAARGGAAYDLACAGCHRADLGGNTGPALREQRFAREFAGKDLRTLFTKIATTMPRNAPASLADDVYLDIVAYVLRENGFPAGRRELTADALDSIRVVPGRPKPPPPVGDYSYVEIVGCLTHGAEDTWTLTQASEATAAVASAPLRPTSPAPGTADRPLGTRTYHLLDALAYAPETHAGQKMYVRGLLIKLPNEQRITISAFETVSPTCRE